MKAHYVTKMERSEGNGERGGIKKTSKRKKKKNIIKVGKLRH